jgi:two-component system sensor histidine kinase YesM
LLWLHRNLISRKFQRRVTLSFILIALLPFIIFTVVVGSIFISQAQDTAISNLAQLIIHISDSMDVYITGLEDMMDYVAAETLDARPPGSMSDERWRSSEREISKTLASMASSHPQVAGILVAFEDDRYVGTGMSRISRDSFADENWYQAACADPEKLVMVSDVSGRNIVTKKDYSVDGVFVIAKAIDDGNGGILGVIMLDIKHELIRESISSVSIGSQGFVYVIDSNDNVVYTPVNDIVYRINPEWLRSNGFQPLSVAIRGTAFHIRCNSSEYSGWRTVGVFSLDEVMGSANFIYYVLLVFIIGITIVVIFISVMIAGSVTKPISKLRALMQEAEAGNLDVRFQYRQSDEIGDLGLSFNHMLDRISQLIQRVYEEQQSKREAQLKSLQEQIKPHFLYNTLDTIAWMARNGKTDEIVKMIEAITSMFRIGLSHGTDFISLKDEITHVTNYMYIQGIRYKNKLSYEIAIDPKISDCMVPKLILQPLAENAIYHGIKLKRSGGRIDITGGFSESGEDIWLAVKDNGAGMSEERLESLNKGLRDIAEGSEHRESFGAFYIQRRLSLSYGSSYGLRLSSKLGEGTTAVIEMPYNKN